MSIIAYQVNNGMPTPISDRKMFDLASGGVTGILSGCTMQRVGERVKIDDGWAIIKGCIIRIKQEQIAVTLAPSGTSTELNGRLSIKLDVSTPSIEFFSEAAASLPAIPSSSRPQEDINGSGNVYYMPLCTYKVDGVQLKTEITDVSPKVTVSSIANISTQVGSLTTSMATIYSTVSGLSSTVGNLSTAISSINSKKYVYASGTANKTLSMSLTSNNTILNITYS